MHPSWKDLKTKATLAFEGGLFYSSYRVRIPLRPKIKNMWSLKEDTLSVGFRAIVTGDPWCTQLSLFVPLLVLFLLPCFVCQIKSLLHYETQKPLPQRISNLSPLCSYWISLTTSSRMHLFPPPVTATFVVHSLLYTAMLYFVHLCISQRAL